MNNGDAASSDGGGAGCEHPNDPVGTNAPVPAVVLVVGLVALILGLAWIANWSRSYNALEGVPHLWLGDAPIGIAKPVAASGGPLEVSDFRDVAGLPGIDYIETDIRLILKNPIDPFVLVAGHDVVGDTDPLSLMDNPTDDPNSAIDEAEISRDLGTLEELLTDPALLTVKWNLEFEGGTDETVEDLNELLDSLSVDEPNLRDRLLILNDPFVLVAVHDVDGVTDPLSLMENPTDDPNSAIDEAEITRDVGTLEELLTDPALLTVKWNLELKGGTNETAEELNELFDTLSIDEPNVRDRLCISYGDIKSQWTVNSIRTQLNAASAQTAVDMCSCASFPEKSALFDWGWAQGLTAPLRPTSDDKVSCVQVLHDLITKRDVEEAHRAGMCIHAWELLLPSRYLGQDLPAEIQGVTEAGLMDEARMHELLDLGVDGIMTYRPDVLADVLASRTSSTIESCTALAMG